MQFRITKRPPLPAHSRFTVGGSLIIKNRFAMKKITLEDVKACIEFEDEAIKNLLSLFCDVWYAIAKRDGKTDHEAAEYTLEKLGQFLLNLSKNEGNPAGSRT